MDTTPPTDTLYLWGENGKIHADITETNTILTEYLAGDLNPNEYEELVN